MWKNICRAVFWFCVLGVVIVFSNVQAAQSGNLVKTQSNSAVYYLGENSLRYVFPDSNVFFSWFADFSDVKTISDQEMATYRLAGNVNVRAGTYLVKITSDPQVYAVTPGGYLRWITTEQIALDLYGQDWAKRVIDVSDSFFLNYKTGEPVVSSLYPAGSVIKYNDQDYLYYISGGKKLLMTRSSFLRNKLLDKFSFAFDKNTVLESDGVLAEQNNLIAAPDKEGEVFVNFSDKKQPSFLYVGQSDKIALGFNQQGEIKEVISQNIPLNVKPGQGGFWVEDVSTGESNMLLGSVNKQADGSVLFEGESKRLGYYLRAVLKERLGKISFDGFVKSLKKEDRVLRLSFRVPVDFTGGLWWNDMESKNTIVRNSEYFNEVSYGGLDQFHVSSFPLASIDFLDAGVTLVQSPEQPRVVRLQYNQEVGFEIEYDFGVSVYTGGKYKGEYPYQASFEFLLMGHNPKYGIRDALDQYYKYYNNVFVSKMSNENVGNLAFSSKDEDIKNLGFAWYKITGNDFGKYTGFSKKSGLITLVEQSPTQYWRSDQWSNPVFGPNYKYTYTNLNDYNARNLLFRDKDSVDFDTVYQQQRRDVTAAVENSAMYITDNTTKKFFRNMVPRIHFYDLDSEHSFLLYSVKADLDLPQPNFASYVWDLKVASVWDNPDLGGFFMDQCAPSTEELIDPFDYRKEQFQYAGSPLTFNSKVKLPANMLGFSYVKYLKRLHSMAALKDKVVVCEFPDRRVDWWFTPFSDALFVSQSGDKISLNDNQFFGPDYLKSLRLLRINAGQKAIVFRQTSPSLQDDPLSGVDYLDYFKKSVLFGVWPGIWYQDNQGQRISYQNIENEIDPYLKAVKILQSAGWQPLSFADKEPSGLMVERFGSPNLGNLAFTVYNNQNKDISFTLKIDKRALGFEDKMVFRPFQAEGTNFYSRDIGDYALVSGNLLAKELLILVQVY